MTLPRLRTWSRPLRLLTLAFVVVVALGYAVGLAFIVHNTAVSPSGIVDHYRGNEDRMKFGKSTGEMLEIVHNHLLGMGMLFFAVGLLYIAADTPPPWKTLIPVETLLTLLSTFGGLWLIREGLAWANWLVFPSSFLMLAGYIAMCTTVIWNCLTPSSN